MQYFDLNIPYLEDENPMPNKQSLKQTRLRLTVKAMELGYSGIAFNRTIKSLMSQSDRCSIPPFPLSSLLSLSPSLFNAVKFRRRLLGVREASPFRQYRRLTVVVETSAQGSVLNSGNPVLKTYDLVAVRPLNQQAFDLACQSSQVDLISIDFGEKLPFRLKLPMVKAAIARGVYFEITYSSLMKDVQVRRQMISSAKLLVEWTRGKNLIVSSAAPSVLELRGPNDVANLSSLFGLSEQCAKAAVSKNCRLLLANALRKRQFYKEAIKVEVMPAGSQTDPKKPWIVDDLEWDPISSGEGDLLLDDLAKSFATSGKVSQTVKAIDFASIVNSVPSSHGLQVKDIGSGVEGKSDSSANVMGFKFTSKDPEVSKQNEKPQKKPGTFNKYSLYQQKSNAAEKSQLQTPESPKASPFMEGLRISSPGSLAKLQKSNAVESNTSPSRSNDLELHSHIASHARDMLVRNDIKETSISIRFNGNLIKDVSLRSEDVNYPVVEANSRLPDSSDLSMMETGASVPEMGDQSNLLPSPDISLNRHPQQMKEDPELDTSSNTDVDMKGVDLLVEGNCSGGLALGNIQQVEEVGMEQMQREEDHAEGETSAEATLLASTMMQVDSFHERNNVDDPLITKSMLSEETAMKASEQIEGSPTAKYPCSDENKSGNCKVKRPVSRQAPMFPFKRLLHVPFKKKGASSMYKTKRR